MGVAAASALIDDAPLICGGQKGHVRVSECYYHGIISNQWKLVGNTVYNGNTGRGKGHGTAFNGKLWAIGGHGSQGARKDIDIVDLEGITTGPTLPYGDEHVCTVALNDNELMIIGGVGHLKDTLIYNQETNEFNNGPTLNAKYAVYYACTTFKSPMHENRMVVMSIASDADYQDVVELLDYTQENAQWTVTRSPKDDGFHDGISNPSSLLPSISGQGVYMQFKQNFFHFTCDTSSCAFS